MKKIWTTSLLTFVGLLFLSVSSVHAGLINDDAEWLASFFPDIDNCTPANLYFDKKSGRSNDLLFEQRGYGKPLIKQDSAIYSVKEQFFGYPATEFSIPAATTSIYTVTVNVEAKKLAEKILKITHKEIGIFYGKAAESGKAYIVKKGKQRSIFVCFTFEGGL